VARPAAATRFSTRAGSSASRVAQGSTLLAAAWPLPLEQAPIRLPATFPSSLPTYAVPGPRATCVCGRDTRLQATALETSPSPRATRPLGLPVRSTSSWGRVLRVVVETFTSAQVTRQDPAARVAPSQFQAAVARTLQATLVPPVATFLFLVGLRSASTRALLVAVP